MAANRRGHYGEVQANIGTQEQWQRIDGRVPGGIGVVNRYSDLTGGVGGASVPLRSLSDRIIFGLSRVCIEESQEILLLAASGYPSGASKLLRGLYERTVTLLYLQKHPEKAERFQHYSAIQEHRVVAAARKLFSDEHLDGVWKGVSVADVDEAYVRVKAEFQKTRCKKCKTTELRRSLCQKHFDGISRSRLAERERVSSATIEPPNGRSMRGGYTEISGWFE